MGKKDVRHADELLAGVTKFVDAEKNVGLYSLKNILKSQDAKKLEIDVEKTLAKSFVDSISTFPKFIIRSAKRLTGNKSVKTEQALEKNKKKLLGYFLEVEKHKRHFDEVFKEKNNLAKVKNILKKGSKEELGAFFKKNKLNSDLLLGKNYSRFEKLKSDVLAGNTEKIKNKYVGSSITSGEAKRTGSFVPNFSGDHALLVNRATSGAVMGYFVGKDFQNLHMLASNDKEGSIKERNKRYKQQASYVGLNVYIDSVINGTFRKFINKSLPFTVGLGFVNAVAANILSRAITGIPLLPKKPEGVDKKPYVINALGLRDNDAGIPAFKAVNSANKKLAFTGWQSSLKKGLQKIDERAVKAMPAKMSYEEFAEGYKTLQKIDSKKGDEVLEIAGKFMGHLKGVPEKAKLSDIEKAAKANNGQVFIGRNLAYRTGKALKDTIVFPFELLAGAGRFIANAGLKIAGKPLMEKAKPNSYSPEVAVKNLVKWSKKAKKDADYTGKVSDMTAKDVHNVKVKYGENFSGFHGPDVMEYGADKLGPWMKLTGCAALPFLRTDAYNKAIEETNNQHISEEKANQRLVQDSARQGISFWIIKGCSNIFKGLANSSLLGSGLTVLFTNTGFETLTRLAVNQPVTTKTHQEMKDLEKKRLASQGFLSKIFERKVKTDNEKVILGSKTLRQYPLNNYAGNSTASIPKKSVKLKHDNFKKNLNSISFA